MRVASKVAVGSGVLLLVFAGAMVYQLTLVRSLVSANRDLSSAKSRAAKLAFDGIRILKEMEESFDKLEATEDEIYETKIESLRKRYADGLEALGSLGLSGEEAAHLSSLQVRWRTLPPTREMSGGGESFADSLRALRGETEGILAAVEASIDVQAEDSVTTGELADRIALAVVAVALALSLLVVGLTVRSINEPLRRLIAGTRAVAEGEFDLELDATRGDEFSLLAADFNAMVSRLGELDEMKKDLLSHVSHELKTPLATLQETQRILLEEVPGPLNEGQRRLLELNLKSSERLSRLISKLLDLSRLEAGELAYDFAPREIGQLVGDAVTELEPRAREARVRLEARLPGAPMELRCDGDRLIQVVENLVENAIKFSPAEGVVQVRVRFAATPPPSLPGDSLPSALYGREDGAGAVLVTVSDSGPGVPDAEKKKVFEKFHQASQRRGGSVGGAGLGLAICRSIVEAHQGALWVTDNSPAGSTFWLLLPASGPRSRGAAVAADSESRRSRGGLQEPVPFPRRASARG
jgi:two-component system sensor histidine kinase GlrK